MTCSIVNKLLKFLHYYVIIVSAGKLGFQPISQKKMQSDILKAFGIKPPDYDTLEPPVPKKREGSQNRRATGESLRLAPGLLGLWGPT